MTYRTWTGWALALLALPAMAGCGSMAVRVERDATVPLPATATYAWGHRGPAELVGERRVAERRPAVQRRIMEETEAQLTAKGWRKVDEEKAEFLVHFHVGAQPREAVVRDGMANPRGAVPVLRCGSSGCWESWQWGAYGPPNETPVVVEYTEGSVLLDVEVRATSALAWRAVGTEPVNASDTTSVAIQRMMARLLRDLPAAGPR